MLFSTLAISLLSLASAAPALVERQEAAAAPEAGRNIVAASSLGKAPSVLRRECDPKARSQHWIIAPGSGQVRTAGSQYCLSAGVGPKDGRRLKLWSCNEPQGKPEWFLTGDNRIALTGKGLCVDNTNGAYKNGNRLQVWTCTDGNTNQVWAPTAL